MDCLFSSLQLACAFLPLSTQLVMKAPPPPLFRPRLPPTTQAAGSGGGPRPPGGALCAVLSACVAGWLTFSWYGWVSGGGGGVLDMCLWATFSASQLSGRCQPSWDCTIPPCFPATKLKTKLTPPNSPTPSLPAQSMYHNKKALQAIWLTQHLPAVFGPAFAQQVVGSWERDVLLSALDLLWSDFLQVIAFFVWEGEGLGEPKP
jgi:hypothetical protein